jgi:hypothetical protein
MKKLFILQFEFPEETYNKDLVDFIGSEAASLLFNRATVYIKEGGIND